MSQPDNGNPESVAALFATDWGDGLRLVKITEQPWLYRCRLHFVTRDGATFTLLLDPSDILVRSRSVPRPAAIIREALAAMV